MNRNKYLLLGSSVGVLALLMAAAVEENFVREWRSIQGEARSNEGPLPIQLRQIVNPGLGATDRCISCHVTMSPGEQGVTIGRTFAGGKILQRHKPVVHDPAEYGCVICHGGQGLATEKRDAHGDVDFWPEPMIPAAHAWAGCGSCHATPGVPSRDAYRRARGAFERLDCLACHRLDGRGGTIRPGGGGMEGPDLSLVGVVGYDKDWYAKHDRQSRAANAGPWKTSFAGISHEDRALLGAYLATLVGASPLIEAKAVFHSSGCMGCHKVSGTGGDEGPDLSRAGHKDPGQLNFSHVEGGETIENWLGEHFRSPGAVAAGSQMPVLGLGESDIRMLTTYMLSLRRRELPGTFLPRDLIRVTRFGEREFSTDGATLFGTFCVGCHGLDGLGRRAPGMAAFPSIANPDFLKLVSDEFLIATVTKGRPGRRMPPWGSKDGGLRAAEVRSVVAYVRSLGSVDAAAPSARWIQPAAAPGKELFASSCSGCHGPQGEGGEGPALNNQVLLANATDTYLVETVSRGRRGTAMAGFLDSSPVHKTLSRGEIESVVAFLRTWERIQQGAKQ